MSAEELGKRTVTATDIYGGNTVEEAAKIFQSHFKRRRKLGAKCRGAGKFGHGLALHRKI